jgi:transcriptional regulator with XRE-family HTH domain
MHTHIKSLRLNRLPEAMLRELAEARKQRGWSQAELGRQTGMPQMHISGIETGKIVPRVDTLLDLVRVLDRDLVMIPRQLVPAVQALIRSHRKLAANTGEADTDLPLYAVTGEPEEDEDDEA